MVEDGSWSGYDVDIIVRGTMEMATWDYAEMTMKRQRWGHHRERDYEEADEATMNYEDGETTLWPLQE